jgi:prepilin-type N-terminal cleavage/methylation domain-containing protein
VIATRTHRRRRATFRARAGFTLIELLVVIIVLAILIGLLLPVIAAALRTAKNAAAQAEINNLAQALASFKSTYGDYPPSRVYLAENGYFPTGNTTLLAPGDISVGALAQRSLIALRKFFPKVVFSTSSQPPQIGANFWYDFNGNGKMDGPYILQGHECLVFFLGGIPLQDPATGSFGMTGFGKDPVNPFTNGLVSDPNYHGNANPMYSGNRQPPAYEFNAGRLFLDPNNLTNNNGTASPGIPGYYDSLGNSPPGVASTTLNFFVYFSSYGSGVYDANDVNLPFESDALGGPPPIYLQFQHAGQLYSSPSPNPYTTTLTANNPTGALSTGSVTFQKAQTFQLFSPGVDGLYGVGGQFIPPSSSSSTASNPLPFDVNNTWAGAIGTPTGDHSIRSREKDNLTNFQSGTLQ